MTKLTAVSNEQLMTELLGQTEQHLHYIDERIAIHKDMLPAFTALSTAAKLAGIELTIASGFRSFERQLKIWNNKFGGETFIKDNLGKNIAKEDLSDEALMHAILLFSALPGASRHHWGSDIDVYATNLLTDDYQLQLEPWEYSPEGPLHKLSEWLNNHAHKYGFYFPYASYQGGVAAEPWHLSYAPISNVYQKKFTKIALEKLLTSSKIFGKEVIIHHLDLIIKRYINNVTNVPKNCYLPD